MTVTPLKVPRIMTICQCPGVNFYINMAILVNFVMSTKHPIGRLGLLSSKNFNNIASWNRFMYKNIQTWNFWVKNSIFWLHRNRKTVLLDHKLPRSQIYLFLLKNGAAAWSLNLIKLDNSQWEAFALTLVPFWRKRT